MSFSFETPVSALSNHQKRVDMISKNIANLNTSGFKGDRMNFMEKLGTVAGSQQFQFSQGSINSTGRATDMAIKGESFFVLQNQNGQDVFSRMGSFNLDKNGELVNPEGMNVQGWMVNQETGKMADTKSDIIIDENMKMGATQTQNVWLTGNLSSKLESTSEQLTTNTKLDSNTNKTAMTTNELATPYTVNSENDEFQISLTSKSGATLASENIELAEDNYNTVSDLAQEINNKINSKSDLYGKVEASVVNVGDGKGLEFRVQNVEDGTAMQLDNVATTNDGATDNFFSDMGLTAGTSTTYQKVTTSTGINNLLQVSEGFSSGNEINISAKLPDGSSKKTSFVYGGSNDGETVKDLLNKINDTYKVDGEQIARAELTDDGKIQVTDTTIGESETSLSLGSGTGTGSIDMPTFITTTEGSEASVNSSSVVYDSIGNSHNISLEFTKPKGTTENYGKWNWEANLTGSEKVISGGSGTIEFDREGNLVSFNYDGGVDGLTFDPRNGSNKMKVQLHAASSDDYKGLSQYNTTSSVKVREQDGNAAGSLNGFRVNEKGSIIGSFTNGQESKLAQVAVAEFTNPDGLEQVGGSNYKATEKSGQANIGKAIAQGSQIMSKSLESSTVELSKQFTKMIESQNSFDAASKVIRTFNEIMDRVVNLKR